MSRNTLLYIASAAGSWFSFHTGWTLVGWFAGIYAVLCFIDALLDLNAYDKMRKARIAETKKAKKAKKSY